MSIEKEVVIENTNGLHARPASMFVQTANKGSSKVTIIKDDESVDGRSIMGLLSLGLEFKSRVKLVVAGPDEVELIAELEKILSSGHL